MWSHREEGPGSHCLDEPCAIQWSLCRQRINPYLTKIVSVCANQINQSINQWSMLLYLYKEIKALHNLAMPCTCIIMPDPYISDIFNRFFKRDFECINLISLERLLLWRVVQISRLASFWLVIQWTEYVGCCSCTCSCSCYGYDEVLVCLGRVVVYYNNSNLGQNHNYQLINNSTSIN